MFVKLAVRLHEYRQGKPASLSIASKVWGEQMMMKKSWYILARKPSILLQLGSPDPGGRRGGTRSEFEEEWCSEEWGRHYFAPNPPLGRFYRCMQPLIFLCMYILWDRRWLLWQLGYIVMLDVTTTRVVNVHSSMASRWVGMWVCYINSYILPFLFLPLNCTASFTLKSKYFPTLHSLKPRLHIHFSTSSTL